MTSASAAAALRKNGCEAVLRATYVDATRSYVMTVGVAVLPNATAATSADSGLLTPRLAAARQASAPGGLPAGVQVVRFRGAGAGRYDYNRQISRELHGGPVPHHVRRRVLRQPAAGAGDRTTRTPTPR